LNLSQRLALLDSNTIHKTEEMTMQTQEQYLRKAWLEGGFYPTVKVINDDANGIEIAGHHDGKPVHYICKGDIRQDLTPLSE
jgi:hypothetical protein